MRVKVVDIHNANKPLFEKTLESSHYIELQLGDHCVVRIVKGDVKHTIEVRSTTGRVEIVPIAANDIVVRVKP